MWFVYGRYPYEANFPVYDVNIKLPKRSQRTQPQGSGMKNLSEQKRA